MMSVDEIIARAGEVGVCSTQQLRGCSDSEIATLENKYGLSFPSAYRRFLELAGHESGLLFRWDHFDVSYAQVTMLTQEQHARLMEDESPPLPADAFIICSRLCEQFEFIRTELGDASPIWYYAEWEPEPVVEYASFPEWLNANLEGAREALTAGYFTRQPE